MNKANPTVSGATFFIPSNQNSFPLKLNIHFELPNKLHRYCTDANSEIEKLIKTDVSFTPPSIQKPHLTLSMGYCESLENYSNILRVVGEFSLVLRAINISLTAPYLKSPQNNYVFTNIVEIENIISIKRDLDVQIGHFMKPLNWNVIEEPPHITLAYLQSDQAQAASLIRGFQTPPSSVCEAISVSICGPRGSCLGSLLSFPLFNTV